MIHNITNCIHGQQKSRYVQLFTYMYNVLDVSLEDR